MKLAVCLLTLAIFVGMADALAADQQTSDERWAAMSPATVVDVTTGDMIRVKTDAGNLRIRLVGIEAPGIEDVFGTDAKKALSDLIFNKDIRYEQDSTAKRDKDMRTLAYVYREKDRLSVNLQMLADGWAKVSYRAIFDRLSDFAKVEAEAKGAGKGLWPVPEAPITAEEEKPDKAPKKSKDEAWECLPWVKVLSTSWQRDEYVVYFTGLVKNERAKPIGYLQISINFYDKNGVQVEGTIVNTINLDAGGTWKFKTVVPEGANTAKFVGASEL